jgi:hypothetical protein
MKTAMQELIEWYQKEHFVKTTFHIQLLNKFESLIEKEKEQIIEAVKFGQNNHTVSIPEDEMIAKNYFNDKYEVVEEFNQNK